MLVSLKELMKDAEKGGYAVGAFNVSNLESLMAIMQAAEETGRGVILNYAEVHAPFLSMEQAALIMLDAAKKAKVPVCVHLDHGSSMESCIQAIRLGFTSVMLDASAEDYETNVREQKNRAPGSQRRRDGRGGIRAHLFLGYGPCGVTEGSRSPGIL